MQLNQFKTYKVVYSWNFGIRVFNSYFDELYETNMIIRDNFLLDKTDWQNNIDEKADQLFSMLLLHSELYQMISISLFHKTFAFELIFVENSIQI